MRVVYNDYIVFEGSFSALTKWLFLEGGWLVFFMQLFIYTSWIPIRLQWVC